MSEFLCADVGYHSLIKEGKILCGDHVEEIRKEDGTVIAVMSDGLGSGVKANILSTLTSTMLSRMLADDLKVNLCVESVTSALPVCSVRQLAYSTFTVVKFDPTGQTDIIQFDSPEIIWIRDGEVLPVPFRSVVIADKNVLLASIKLQQEDTLISVSDGAENAGVGEGMSYDHAWGRDHIAEYIAPLCCAEFSAKTLNAMILEECYRRYEGMVYDDTTSVTICIKPCQQVNLMFGAPEDPNDDERVLSLFFSRKGKHIVCGGTTAKVAGRFLKQPLTRGGKCEDDPEIPAIFQLEGVDLVTEGIITINRVLEYARDYLDENLLYEKWSFSRDGASQIARLLFEEATNVNIFIGRALNPAHQSPDMPISFNVKMQIIKELAECLKEMGKTIRINYF